MPIRGLGEGAGEKGSLVGIIKHRVEVDLLFRKIKAIISVAIYMVTSFL